VSSVVALTADLIEKGELEFQREWMPDGHYQQIREACECVGVEWMKPLKEALPEEIPYDQVRLVLAQMRREKKAAK